MAKNETYVEGPAGYNGQNGPGDATKMPTKHYPSSGKLGEGVSKHKDTVISGPCDDCNGMYHK